MSDSSDGDPFSMIEKTRGRLEAKARRKQVWRQPERRLRERRGLGFTAQRKDDASVQGQLRASLLAYLRRLPEDTLWRHWIDGLWLGQATEAHLRTLVTAAAQSGRPDQKPRGSRLPGRPPTAHHLLPDVPSILSGSLRYEWRRLRARLVTFCAVRDHHHAPMNRKRNGAPISLEHRNSCLKSAIGQQVERAGLFAEFFDAPRRDDQPLPTPAAMAARLLHRERQRQLTTLEQHARAEAAKAVSDDRRELWAAWATQAAADRQQFPTWRTLYRNLKESTPRQPR